MIYVREGQIPGKKPGVNPKYTYRPYNLKERAEIARVGAKRVGIVWPILMDDLDSPAERAYGAWPMRSCVVDIDGKVAYHGPHYQGKRMVKPGQKPTHTRGLWNAKEVEKAIQAVLANDGKHVKPVSTTGPTTQPATGPAASGKQPKAK